MTWKMNKLGLDPSHVKARPQISSQQAGAEQEKLGPRVPTGRKECAIFETSSASARSTSVLCLGGEITYFTCTLLIYSQRARVQILF